MLDYDAALKTILKSLSPPVFRMLTGSDEVVRWHEIDLPDIRNLRADLVGETSTGDLVHIELQSTNDPDMALRMLEYALAIRRHLGRFPIQIVLYAGAAPMKMPSAFDARELSFRYRVVDMRVIESELEKRVEAIRALEILAGLRRLGSFVKQEISMPILDDILDHNYYGPKLREGIARGEEPGRVLGREEGHLTGHFEGRIAGHREGRLAGRLEGERHLILRQIEKRFGQVPAWVASRLDSMSRVEIEAVALRLFDAGKIEDLFSPN